jgi:hypothetical protein
VLHVDLSPQKDAPPPEQNAQRAEIYERLDEAYPASGNRLLVPEPTICQANLKTHLKY